MFKPFLLRRHFLVQPIPQAEMFPLSFSWLVLEMLVFVAAGIDLLGRDRERKGKKYARLLFLSGSSLHEP